MGNIGRAGLDYVNSEYLQLFRMEKYGNLHFNISRYCVIYILADIFICE